MASLLHLWMVTGLAVGLTLLLALATLFQQLCIRGLRSAQMDFLKQIAILRVERRELLGQQVELQAALRAERAHAAQQERKVQLLMAAIDEEVYGQRPGMDETRSKIERVLSFHQAGTLPTPEGIAELGGGWIAEEALSIGLWCALMAETFEQGVLWAVNHSGDSDSTGLIAGHLLGMQLGVEAIPQRWLRNLELRQVIEQVAQDIEWVPQHYCGDGGEHDGAIWARYPGW
ncbi:ADP-ribosylglycohydrolase family protein [Pseudomonas sp. TMP25]|uniref:ADP-ribosylglycohydrolase family protein n=1 Tax=Pseudomonas sp. TMP25 TaxID=3136561 RepID=UPI0031014901